MRQFAEWRNDIVHHFPAYDEDDASKQVPTLLNFLAEYINRELGAPLKEFLPRHLFGPAQKALDKWRVVVLESQRRASEEGCVIAQPCPTCSIADVVCVSSAGATHCHVCGACPELRMCGICRSPVLAQYMRLDDDEAICFACASQLLRVQVIEPLTGSSSVEPVS